MGTNLKIPPEAKGRIKAVCESKECSHIFYLADFTSMELEEAYKLLNKYDMRKGLREAISRELRLRKPYNKTDKNITGTYRWFEPLWWAVMSLFDKGDCDKNDEYTKSMLSKIDDNWKYNCGGMM